MNSRWALTLLLILAAGSLSFALVRRACVRPRSDVLTGLQDVSALTRELSLTPDQARQLQALHAALADELDEACMRHCSARARMAASLSAGTNGQAAAEAALAEMGRAYEGSERATLAHIRKVQALLTDAQRARFDALVRASMERECSMPGASGATMDQPHPAPKS